MGEERTVSRFAPSPTGALHLGHAYSARQVWEAAGEGGRVLLRIENIDPGRCRVEHEAAIKEDLRWLGLTWEGAVRRQSEHLADYARALEGLEARGLIYPCFCTRREIQEEVAEAGGAPHGPLGVVYPGTCRGLDAGERRARVAAGDAYALRLDLAAARAQVGGGLRWYDRGRGWVAARPEVGGDVVLARKETPASYHLAVVHDDALQGVTLVTRGEDLFFATHIHRLLQALLGYEAPEYNHHRLLVDGAGQRLANRRQAQTLASLRASGVSAAQVWAMVDAQPRAEGVDAG